jgi:hypothetical protein
LLEDTLPDLRGGQPGGCPYAFSADFMVPQMESNNSGNVVGSLRFYGDHVGDAEGGVPAQAVAQVVGAIDGV